MALIGLASSAQAAGLHDKKTLLVAEGEYVNLSYQSTGSRNGFFITLAVPGASTPFLLCGSSSSSYCYEWLKTRTEVNCSRWNSVPSNLKTEKPGSPETYSESNCQQDMATKITLETATVLVSGRDVVELRDNAGFSIVDEPALNEIRRTGVLHKMLHSIIFLIIIGLFIGLPLYKLKKFSTKKENK